MSWEFALPEAVGDCEVERWWLGVLAFSTDG